MIQVPFVPEGTPPLRLRTCQAKHVRIRDTLPDVSTRVADLADSGTPARLGSTLTHEHDARFGACDTIPSARGTMVAMSIGEELLEERQRRRRAGDPRITPEGREILLRLVSGDLVDEFQAALDAVSAADPLLGGGDIDDDA